MIGVSGGVKKFFSLQSQRRTIYLESRWHRDCLTLFYHTITIANDGKPRRNSVVVFFFTEFCYSIGKTESDHETKEESRVANEWPVGRSFRSILPSRFMRALAVAWKFSLGVSIRPTTAQINGEIGTLKPRHRVAAGHSF